MTSLVETRTPAALGAVHPEVAAVADNFVELMRTFNRARSHMLAAAAHDVEWSAHVLLRCLHNEGSMRAGALAEVMQSDPSTVSRQVAALVKDGLLERRADPDDGRASLLVLTAKAHRVLDDHAKIRLDYFAEMLDDWSQDDLRTFAEFLQRFTTNYEHTNSNWMAERLAARPVSAGGTN